MLGQAEQSASKQTSKQEQTKPQKPINVPVYRHPLEVARENGELDLYLQNRKLNTECTAAIDQAIRDCNYKENHYDLRIAAKTVQSEYGKDRVDWVLADIIQNHMYDGRYSYDNKAWAKCFDIPKKESGLYPDSHPYILNGFIERHREIAQEKPSLLEALEANERKSKKQFGQKAEPGKDAQIRAKPKKDNRLEV